MATTDRRGVSVDATDTPVAGDPNPGLAIKAPCLVATTANITLSGLQTVDGVVLAAGNRVLVWQQTDQTTNGLYNVASSGWTRAIDADSNADFASGMLVAVTQGAVNGGTQFKLTSADPTTLGTTAITFTQAAVNASRTIHTTAPLTGGGNLGTDLTLAITGSALSAVNDTNVTATIGGSIVSLLAATSVTMGWSGTLAVARGGTGGGAASGTLLDNITGFSSTGFLTRTGAGTYAFQSATNGITNANLAQAAAWTLKGNPTSGTANEQDFTVDSLTLKASPASNDELLLWDVSGSAMKKATVTAVAAGATVSSIAGNTGAFTLSHGLTNSVNDLQIDIGTQRSYLAGLTLSTAGSSSTFSVAAGVGVDSTNADFMKLTSSISKTTGAWAVGSGNGSLDVGTISTSTWYHAYEIKRTDTGVVDILTSQAPDLAASVTATNASPCVFTWNGGTVLPFANGAPVVLSGTTAPTGFTLGTQYFVVAANIAAGTFELSATQGGAAINSSSTGSGLTATSAPVMPSNYTLRRRIGSMLTDGSSHWTLFHQFGDEFLWDAQVTDVNLTPGVTTAVLRTFTVPIGVQVTLLANMFCKDNTSAASSAIITSPDASDQAPGTFLDVITGSVSTNAATFLSKRTSTAAQLRTRMSTTTLILTMNTYGWIDRRGRDS